jgi:hypothetical protein
MAAAVLDAAPGRRISAAAPRSGIGLAFFHRLTGIMPEISFAI